jgi:hypothetical protein
MNSISILWNDDKLLQVNDQDAYNHILTNYVVELNEHK